MFAKIKYIYRVYRRRGFRITHLHVDGQFEPLREMIESMPGGPVVVVANDNEHVPAIERRIRMAKERIRGVRSLLPFDRMPKLMVIHLVLHIGQMLTYFPTKGGISQEISPRTILLGQVLDRKKHLDLEFGEYCQVHEENNPKNSDKARTLGAICLGPTGNEQGGYKFMSLVTGEKITRHLYDALPMPDSVIKRVNKLGKDMPRQLTFTDRSGNIIGDVLPTGVDDRAVEQQAPPIFQLEEDQPEQVPQIQDPGLDDHEATDWFEQPDQEPEDDGFDNQELQPEHEASQDEAPMPEPDAIEPAVQAPAPVAAEPERRVQFADPS